MIKLPSSPDKGENIRGLQWKEVFMSRISKRNRTQSDCFELLMRAYSNSIEENHRLLASIATFSIQSGGLGGTGHFKKDNAGRVGLQNEFQDLRKLEEKSAECDMLRHLVTEREEELRELEIDLNESKALIRNQVSEIQKLRDMLLNLRNEAREKARKNEELIVEVFKLKEAEESRLHDLHDIFTAMAAKQGGISQADVEKFAEYKTKNSESLKDSTQQSPKNPALGLFDFSRLSNSKAGTASQGLSSAHYSQIHARLPEPPHIKLHETVSTGWITALSEFNTRDFSSPMYRNQNTVANARGPQNFAEKKAFPSLLVASSDGRLSTICLTQRGESLRTINSFSGTPTKLLIDTVDANIPLNGILAATEDFAINLYNYDTLRGKATLRGHTNRVITSKFLKQNTVVVCSIGRDHSIRLWDANKSCCIQARHILGSCTAGAVAKDSLLKACGCRNGRVYFYGDKPQSIEQVASIEPSQSPCKGIVFFENPSLVATLSASGELHLIDVRMWRPLYAPLLLKGISRTAYEPSYAIAASKDDKYIAVGSGAQLGFIRLGLGNEKLKMERWVDSKLDVITSVTNFENGMVTGHIKGTVALWDWDF